MANLSIRNLKEETYYALKEQALRHGVSMEEEARQLLEQASHETESIAATFQRYFGPENGINLDEAINEHRRPHEPMSFSK